MSFFVGAMIASTLYGAYQEYEAGKADQDALLRKAKLLKAQADEVLERNFINRKLLAKAGEQALGSQVSSFAEAGVQASEGSALMIMERTALAVAEELQRVKREGDYEAMAIRNESSFSRESAESARNVGSMRAFGTMIQGAGNIAQATK